MALFSAADQKLTTGQQQEAGLHCIAIDGIDLAAIHVPGAGRPVVFLHGNSSTKAVWRHQIEIMRRVGREALAPDLPGHGESGDAPKPETTYSFPGYAALIGGLLDALGWECVDVVGWSLGGHIGLEMLATDLRIQSLLIVGTPPVQLTQAAVEEAFFADKDMLLAGKPEFTEADALAYGSAMMGGEAHLTSELLRAIRRTDGNARKFMFANALKGVGTDQRLTATRNPKPLCVVHGQEEPFVRLEYLLSLRYRALWRKRVHVIPKAGHAPHWQYPQAFNQILLDFLGLESSR